MATDDASEGDRFDRATAVVPVDGAGGRWSGEVADGWDVVGRAHGGYLLAIASRAMQAATGRPDPVTVTGHYLAQTGAGPATVDVDVVRSGRRFATASATLTMEGREILSVLGTFGDLGGEHADPSAAAPELVLGEPPEMPAPDDCPAMVPGDPLPPRLAGQVEMRLHPDDAQFLVGRRSGQARMRGWFRLRDGEPMTTNALLCAVDAFPPTIFNVDLPVGWTPTVELTAHIRARPAPGWLACSFSTRFVTGGFLEADGEVWDSAGRVVALSRQLALVPRA